jgi:uncharacterized protein YegP (UPF0339 family)
MTPLFHIFRSPKNKQWYFRLTARNGKTICQSEGHKTKSGVVRGVMFLRKNAPIAEVRA